MKKIYSEWIRPETVCKFHKESQDLTHFKKMAQEIMMLIRYFGKKPCEMRFFDYGIGWCKWALMAQGFGLQIYGTEIDASRMEFARNRGIEVIPPENIPGMEFDFINTEQVLEHVPNPFETVQLLKEGLKKGGILKISVPNGNGALRAMRRIDWSRSDASKCSPMPFFPLEHINTYSTRCLTALGRRAGLQPVRIPVGVWIVDLKLSTWKDSLKVLLGPLRRKLNPRGAYILFRKNF